MKVKKNNIGYIVALVLMFAAAAGLLGVRFEYQNRPAEDSPKNIPAVCVDGDDEPPIITSISSFSGSSESELEISGCNFSGFEGDESIWIENCKGIRGFLMGKEGSDSKFIKVDLNSRICTQDTSYSGLPCEGYLELIPGTYEIYVEPWGIKSNKVIFVVK